MGLFVVIGSEEYFNFGYKVIKDVIWVIGWDLERVRFVVNLDDYYVNLFLSWKGFG